MNLTLEKFGYPGTLVREFRYWVALLRPQQITLGCLVLACKEDATSFGGISSEAAAELPLATQEIERTLRALFDFQKINYLMLMMVDPNVHFHVIPRYAALREFEGATFSDRTWPKAPDVTAVNEVSADVLHQLQAKIGESWIASSRG